MPPSPPKWARRRVAWGELGRTLEGFDARFPRARRLAGDPLHLAHGWDRPEDAEIAALVAASLAFGRASALIEKARLAIDGFGPDLSAAVQDLREGDVPPHLEHLVHRWVSGRDLALLLSGAGRLQRRHGSLGAAFRSGMRDDDDPAHLLDPLRRFARSLAPEDGSRRLSPGARYLLSVPDGRAAAKRWSLLLRWMVRPADGVDLGLWSDLGTRRLTIPLDTHVARIGAYLGLTDRRTPGWAMAREITANLARFDAADPTRFDFALSHLGIMGGCPSRRNLVKCAGCDLVSACRL